MLKWIKIKKDIISTTSKSALKNGFAKHEYEYDNEQLRS